MMLIWALSGGLGLALIVDAFLYEPWPRRKTGQGRIRTALLQAGIVSVTPGRFLIVCTCTALTAALLTLAVTGSFLFAALFGGFGAFAPWVYLRYQANKRRNLLREQWPEVVDHLRSAVRAGLSLPESLSQLAHAGPETLRPAFRDFALDYRATANFALALDHLSLRLSDPVADKILTTLRITREVGGTELGHTLGTLAAFLRDDVKTRGELAARQSWIISAARLAVAAPWIVLLVLGTQPAAIGAYSTPAGVILLGAGLLVSFICYRIMLRLGTLPVEERVLI
ncbi:type II secretion system F family protein [Glutamicibacter uratoxydans]|uniref:type II secretion system F family protein n=1 Tax=Glutamicibacter uratoxydans TaxID=43667 RepID=UPI003D6E2F61